MEILFSYSNFMLLELIIKYTLNHLITFENAIEVHYW